MRVTPDHPSADSLGQVPHGRGIERARHHVRTRRERLTEDTNRSLDSAPRLAFDVAARHLVTSAGPNRLALHRVLGAGTRSMRSEERRVGKEGRAGVWRADL